MKGRKRLRRSIGLVIAAAMVLSLAGMGGEGEITLPAFTQNAQAATTYIDDDEFYNDSFSLEVGETKTLYTSEAGIAYRWDVYAFPNWTDGSSIVEITSSSYNRECTFKALKTGQVRIRAVTKVKNTLAYSRTVTEYWIVTVTKSSSSSGTTSGSSSSGKKKIKPSSITLNKSTMTIIKGKSKKLKYTISPSNANSKKKVTFSSSNPKIAKVNQKGKVTALKKGTATITVRTANGKTDTCKVTVKEINAKKITLNKKKLKLLKGKTAKLTYTLTPSNATSTVTWTSSNKKVATVNAKGKVKAKKGGKAKITAKTSDGKKAVCKVTVKSPITGVSLNKSSVTLKKGKTCKLKATVKPADTTSSKKLTWTSSNTKVATVNSKGKITAKNAGTATITVRTSNGKTAKCKVTVKIPITSVSMSCTDKTVDVGDSFSLKVNIKPSDTTEDTTVTWRSSDTSVATVDSAGNVTTVDDGYCTISASVGGHTVICRLTVERPITEITLDYTSVTVSFSVGITATITSGTTDDRTITWTSSDTSVATVNPVQLGNNCFSTGYVYAVGPGTCTVTATASNGLSASCVVTVPDD